MRLHSQNLSLSLDAKQEFYWKISNILAKKNNGLQKMIAAEGYIHLNRFLERNIRIMS